MPPTPGGGGGGGGGWRGLGGGWGPLSLFFGDSGTQSQKAPKGPRKAWCEEPVFLRGVEGLPSYGVSGLGLMRDSNADREGLGFGV